MYVCLCLCLYGREVTVGYARLQCPLAALRSAIEFLFWDHWETAVLGQILAGRSREVTGGHGSKFLPFGRSRRLNFYSGIIAKRPFWAKSWPGGHGRSWEVGRLRAVTEGETEESAAKRIKKVRENQRK